MEEADKVRADLVDVSERLRTSEDVLKRTVITAPVSGTIINMGLKTVGGVIQRGQAILEIVPSNDKLIIDARVSPTDIQRIHPGLEAQVHLLAYSSRQMPKISGIVRSVSPDRVRESDGQQEYYLARVEIDRKKLKEKAPNAQLIAGMPADVMIVAEERTVLEYLLQPLKYALRRAMRES